jgi:hypothetical protein
MADSGCRKTTRVAQAIETLQLLHWTLRTGQFEVTRVSLALSTEEFDNEWQWLGSYGTWRSAMFLFLYPENLLDPSWREKLTQSTEELWNSGAERNEVPGSSPPRYVLSPLGKQTFLYQAIVKILSGTIQAPQETPTNGDDESDEPLDPVDEIANVILGRLALDTNATKAKIASATYDNLLSLRLQDPPDDIFTIYEEGPTGATIEVGRVYSGDAIEEDALHLPLLFALTLQRDGNFVGALDWFRRLYDYDGDGLSPNGHCLPR